MYKYLSLLIFLISSIAFADEAWDAKTSFGATQALTQLAKLDFSKDQVEKLLAKAKAIEKVRAEFADKEVAFLKTEQGHANELAQSLLGGSKLTELQGQRADELRNRFDQIPQEREAQIDIILSQAVNILRPRQIDQLTLTAEDRQRAQEFLQRVKAEPGNTWNREANQYADRLIRPQMRQLLRDFRRAHPDIPMDALGGRGNTGNNANNRDRGRRNQPSLNASQQQAVQQLRQQMDAIRVPVMDELNSYRSLGWSDTERAIDRIMREQVGQDGVHRRVVGYLRRMLTPEGASAGLAAYAAKK